VLLDLCAELRALGQDSLIASIGDGSSGEKPLERAARGRGVDVRPVRMAPGPNPFGALRLTSLARAADVDIIHSHGYKGDILLGFLPRQLRPVPVIATVHGYTDLDWSSRMAWYRLVDRHALQRLDCVVLVHGGMREAVGLDRMEPGRVRVIENGIQVREIESAAALDRDIVAFCRQRSVVIGAIGRLSPEKGFDVLLRAAALVLPSLPGAGLVILGEGPERRRLDALVCDLGLAGRVLLPGYQAEARSYLRLFHVFALPSLTEGLPITLLEAMAAGVAIVATRVGGVPHALDQGRGGTLVGPNDAGTLAEAILGVLSNPEAAAPLAAHARAQVPARFSSQAMAARYLELYQQLEA
jgi:glycosyltransferase involved in cell wall biosynthesis